ncbi:heat shock protein HslVU, ATPase subunit HslU, partial [Reticulomyxa filosa]
QQKALFAAEGVDLEFTDDAIRTIAKYSRQLNENLENIGARRLRAVISKIVEDLSYDAPEKKGEKISVGSDFIAKQLSSIIADQDLSKYIL